MAGIWAWTEGERQSGGEIKWAWRSPKVFHALPFTCGHLLGRSHSVLRLLILPSISHYFWFSLILGTACMFSGFLLQFSCIILLFIFSLLFNGFLLQFSCIVLLSIFSLLCVSVRVACRFFAHLIFCLAFPLSCVSSTHFSIRVLQFSPLNFCFRNRMSLSVSVSTLCFLFHLLP